MLIKKRLVFLSNYQVLFCILCSIALIYFGLFNHAFAAGSVSTIGGLRGNTAHTLSVFVGIVSSVAVIGGLALIYSGIVNLYKSHTKQGAGGKSGMHGVTLLLCGALFIGLPYTYSIVSSSFWDGSKTKIGETGSPMRSLFSGIIGPESQLGD